MSIIEKFAVIGDPIDHSKSPKLHEQFGKEFQLTLSYERLQTRAHELETQVNTLINSGYRGFNITLPLKEKMYRIGMLRNYELSEKSLRAKSVNTVFIDRGNIFLDNTDGIGFMNSLRKLKGYDVQKKDILILGAGGATRGILSPLLDAMPKSVTVSNRSIEKLSLLKKQFGSPLLDFCPLSDLQSDVRFDEHRKKTSYNLIINATSSSVLSDKTLINQEYFSGTDLVVDLFYSNNLTDFLKTAKQYGCKQVMDGFPMLVEQAAESFFIWTGLYPNTGRILSKRGTFFTKTD